MQTNKYEVLGVVGEGAYGIVYKCRNKETNEFVAIKKFKETNDELVKKTMKRELRMLQLLNHENIVCFKEAFKRKGNLFLVFEYVERNLLELLQDHPRGLDPKLIRSLIFQLCKSIKYLHDKNIIHRDIKPENLLVNDSMVLKLCDFGFARTIKNTPKEQLTDYVATRWYRAPELLLTQGIYGPEVDYWAIGCIMGELVDGNPLFPGENEIDQLHCIQKVLGNFTEEQVEMFYGNPLLNGKNLLDVVKPETLERRYLGKLPKVAITFMKGLLCLDPKKRLNGSTVFLHPYFEKLMEVEKSKILSQRSPHSHQDINGGQSNNINPIPNTTRKPIIISNKENIQNDKKTNVTNINIINYNNYADNGYQNEPQSQHILQPHQIKVRQDNLQSTQQPQYGSTKQSQVQKPKMDNAVYTSINFNQNSKEINNNNNNPNTLSLASNAIQMDNVYKTFYQKTKEKDSYNIDIDLQNCNNGNNMKNYVYTNNKNLYQNSNNNEEEKQSKEKKKQKSMYKGGNNMKIYDHSHSPSINKYYKNSSPPKNNYYQNNGKYNSKNLHLPVIPKGTVYNNNINYKKYNYY